MLNRSLGTFGLGFIAAWSGLSAPAFGQTACDGAFPEEFNCECGPDMSVCVCAGIVTLTYDGGTMCVDCGAGVESLEGFCSSIVQICGCPGRTCWPSLPVMCADATVACRCKAVKDDPMMNCEQDGMPGIDCGDLAAFLDDPDECPLTRGHKIELACCYLEHCIEFFEEKEPGELCNEVIGCVESLLMSLLTFEEFQKIQECIGNSPSPPPPCDGLCLINDDGVPFWWESDENGNFKCDWGPAPDMMVNCTDLMIFIGFSILFCNDGNSYTDDELLSLACFFFEQCGGQWDVQPGGSVCDEAMACVEALLQRALTPCEENLVAGCLGFNDCPDCCHDVPDSDAKFLECGDPMSIQCDRDCDEDIDCEDMLRFVEGSIKCTGIADHDMVIDLMCEFLNAVQSCSAEPPMDLCVGLADCIESVLEETGFFLMGGDLAALGMCTNCPTVCRQTGETGQTPGEGGADCGGCGEQANVANPTDGTGVDVTNGDKVLACGDDVSVAVDGRAFSVGRQHNSNPAYESSCAGGENWSYSSFAYLDDQGANLSLNLGARGNVVVPAPLAPGGGTSAVPGPTSQYVVKASVRIDYVLYPTWRLVEPGQWEMDFLRANSGREEMGTDWFQVGVEHEGLLIQTRDEYGDEFGNGNQHTYVYQPVGLASPAEVRLTQVYVNGTPGGTERPDALIRFRYDSTPTNAGRVREISVSRFDQADQPVVTQRVAYRYMDSTFLPLHADLGTDGDLIQVTRSERVDPPSGSSAATWRVRVTQYRYHSDAVSAAAGAAGGYSFAGSDHQIKMEILPEQMEYYAQQAGYSSIELAASDLLGLADTAPLPGQPGLQVVDLASQVIEQYEPFVEQNPGPGEHGRVLVQHLLTACGCGGGGTQGTEYSYEYVNRDGDEATAETAIVTERTLDSGGLPYRKHYFEMAYPGSTGIPYLVTRVIEQPTPQLLWVAHYEYDPLNRNLTRLHTPASIDHDSYVPGQGAIPGFLGTGLVYEYTYTADNRLTETRIRNGTPGTAFLIHRTVYPVAPLADDERLHLPTRVERYRLPGVTSGDETNDLTEEWTEFSYGFHTNGRDDLAWVERRMEAEDTSENGPVAAWYTSHEMFDARGNNFWSRAADGCLTRRTFDLRTGQVLTMRRNAAKEDGLPATFGGTQTELDTSAWKDRHANGLSLTTQYVRDLPGRVIEHVSPGQVSTYTRREMRSFDLGNGDGRPGLEYYAVVTLPHELATGGFNGPVSVSWYNADDDLIGTVDQTPTNLTVVDPGGQSGYWVRVSAYALGVQLAQSEVEHDVSGLVTAGEVWHRLGANPASYTTKYFYDALGRVDYVLNANRTVHRSRYDVLDRVVASEVGVPVSAMDDTPDENEMSTVVEYFFDHTGPASTPAQGAGNGNVTLVRQHVDGTSGTQRVTVNTYDFRDRLVATENPDRPYHGATEYDNLDRVIRRALFGPPAPFPTPPVPTSNVDRVWYVEMSYSQRGLSYREAVAIDPSQPSLEFLETHRWFDQVGRVVATWGPNAPRTKTSYDGLGRPVREYVTDGRGPSGYDSSYVEVYDADPPGMGFQGAVVTDDIVFEQSEYRYVTAAVPFDHAGMLEQVTTRRRTHDAGEAGDVGDLEGLVSEKSIVSFQAEFYDDADRVSHTANYGTNKPLFEHGGMDPGVMQGGPPAPSETVLVTMTTYDSRNLVETETSPDGRVTKYFYDDMDRRIAVSENHEDADVSWSVGDDRWTASNIGGVGAMGETLHDVDRVTSFVYDGLSNVVKNVAHLPAGGGEMVQVTSYEYAVDGDTSGNPLASTITSKDLLGKVVYPEEKSGTPSEEDRSVYYAYNRQGELVAMEDQNDTRHDYTLDDLGRLVLDSASFPGTTDIDQTVKAIGTSYDDAGRRRLITSFNTAAPTLVPVTFEPTMAGQAINQVELGYTPLWQVTDVWQEPHRFVDANTLKVHYGYQDSDVEEANFSRRESLTYPDGSQVDLLYGAAQVGPGFDELDVAEHKASRLDALAYATGNAEIARYDYAGLDLHAIVDIPGVNGQLLDVQLDRTAAHNGRRQWGPSASDPSRNNPGVYPGFDRFGRAIRHMWVDGTFRTNLAYATVPNIPPIVELAYEYDADSNRTAAYDDRPGSGQPLSHGYEYDGLDRLKKATRGDWVGGMDPIPTPDRNTQEWDLDALGNWKKVLTDANGDMMYTDGEIESRIHDGVNELVERVRPNSLSQLLLTYDKAGNLRTERLPLEIRTYTHDAWNRLVEISATLAGLEGQYVYNGLHWRVAKRSDADGSPGLDEERLMYYCAEWQLAEERIDDEAPFPADPDPESGDIDRHVQYVWGARYIDDVILHRQNSDPESNDDYDDPGDAYYYHLTDVLFSTVALLDGTAKVKERVTYTAYGQAHHQWGNDVDGDGDADGDDVTAVQDIMFKRIFQPEYRAEADLNRSGGITGADATIAGVPNAALPPGTLTAAAVDNQIGYDGYVFNAETKEYHVRYRGYNPELGRWLERDPAGYADGMALYEYVRGQPIRFLDPFGLERCHGISADNILGGLGGGEHPGAPLGDPKDGEEISLGPLAFSWSLGVSGSCQVCKKCCPEGTQEAGSSVWDYNCSITAHFAISASAATHRVRKRIGDAYIDMWAGVYGEIFGKFTASGSLQSDYCNGVGLTGEVCGSYAVGVALEFGAWGEVGYKSWSKGVGLKGRLEGSVYGKACLRCRDGECCVYGTVCGNVSGSATFGLLFFEFTFQIFDITGCTPEQKMFCLQ